MSNTMSNTKNLNIGILGTGHIGKILARKLAQAGHNVKVANSRGPQTIEADTLEFGARAVEAAETVKDVDVVILSIPLNRIPAIAPLLTGLPEETVVIDTSNYYPQRDGHIPAVDNGQIESLWVQEQFGHPVIKAWNNILAGSFEDEGLSPGSEGRIALSVAGDDLRAKRIAMDSVETTGFDAIDGGTLEESWRQQPGTPGYCVDFQADALKHALATAIREEAPRHRDLAVKEIEKMNGNFVTADLLRINRATYVV